MIRWVDSSFLAKQRVELINDAYDVNWTVWSNDTGVWDIVFVLVTDEGLETLRERLRFFFPPRLCLEGLPKRIRSLLLKDVPENSKTFFSPLRKRTVLCISLLFCILGQLITY